MTDWNALSARAGVVAHDLVGWLMWDPGAIARYEALGVPGGNGWIVAWRLAALGDARPAVGSATAYSMAPEIISVVLDLHRGVATPDDIVEVRDASIEPGLDDITPGLTEQLAGLAPDLWQGVDAVHYGMRPLFAAHRALPRADPATALATWQAVNCLRELRGDNHWALCAAEDLDAVEVGLLHSVMVDMEEYGSEEWIARSRGNDDAAIAAGWARLESKGFATDGALNDAGRAFRHDLEARTDALTAPAWEAAGEAVTVALCNAVEPHHDAFLARIDATAGPRWMPALRSRSNG